MRLTDDLPSTLRLAPRDRPRGLLLRLAAWYSRRRFGKVMTPLRVVYPRLPGLLPAQLGLYRLAHSGLSIDRELKFLLEVRISRKNVCHFCTDLHHAVALSEGFSEAKLAALATQDDDALFDERERAAFRYVDEMAERGDVSDETFEELRRHFSERELVEIVWLNAFTTYLNLMAKPLGMVSDGFCAIVREGNPEAARHLPS